MLSFPLYRSWAVVQRVRSDAADLLTRGRAPVVRSLLEMKAILDESEVYEVYSRLWVDEMIAFVLEHLKSVRRQVARSCFRRSTDQASLSLAVTRVSLRSRTRCGPHRSLKPTRAGILRSSRRRPGRGKGILSWIEHSLIYRIIFCLYLDCSGPHPAPHARPRSPARSRPACESLKARTGEHAPVSRDRSQKSEVSRSTLNQFHGRPLLEGSILERAPPSLDVSGWLSSSSDARAPCVSSPLIDF